MKYSDKDQAGLSITAAAYGAEFLQLTPINKGDATLGMAAAWMGYNLATAMVGDKNSRLQLHSQIRDLCRKP